MHSREQKSTSPHSTFLRKVSHGRSEIQGWPSSSETVRPRRIPLLVRSTVRMWKKKRLFPLHEDWMTLHCLTHHLLSISERKGINVLYGNTKDIQPVVHLERLKLEWHLRRTQPRLTMLNEDMLSDWVKTPKGQ